MGWLPVAGVGTCFPVLSLCRTMAILGEGVVREQLIPALAAHGVDLTEADALEADCVVVLHGLGQSATQNAFAELTRLAARPSPPRLLVGAARDDADGAAFVALVKTAAVEWSADCKCVALDNAVTGWGLAGSTVGTIIAAELAQGGSDHEVRLGPVRAVRSRVPGALPRAPRELGEGPWIVSGGGRGVTATCSLALVQAGVRQIALLGRTVLEDEPAVCRSLEDEADIKRTLIDQAGGPPDLRSIARHAASILAQRQIRASMARMAAAGAEVRYESIDVADHVATRRVVTELRRAWGPIRGLVHGAGVVADKRLGEKTPAQFTDVLRTKIDGARALLDACADDPLEQVCFFSSVAAHAGNAGQSDYAAANAALERLARDEQARRGPQCHVVSIAWGPWDGGMVTASLARHFAARGIGLIPLAAGADAFIDELCRGTETQVIVGCELDAVRGAVRERVRFDRRTLPILADHRVGGAENPIVLPVTLALDALVGAGRRLLGPHLEARDLRVLKGVVFDGDDAELELRSEDLSPGRVLATLFHASGRPAYRVELTVGSTSAPAASHLSRRGTLPEACRTPYAGVLFHGPAFQVIREVLECGEATISARIATAAAMNWGGQWQIDPAALDGALQLLRLWGATQDGRVSLPTSIGRCRVWSPWADREEVGCTVNCRRDDVDQITGDALFIDLETGAPLLSLDGVVMHVHAQ